MTKTKKLVNRILATDSVLSTGPTFYLMKVLEESTEVNKELIDHINKDKNNLSDIQSELADLKAAILLFEADLERQGFESFSDKTELLVNRKLRNISKSRQNRI